MISYIGRYVFVAGLHRTGTSLIARIIGSHAEVDAITNSSAPEDEGCYLQGAIPHTAIHGIPGEYATDPAQHYVEGCAFDTMETRNRISSDWAKCYKEDASWRVEKSPVNLTRMRLYQQLFPMSHFVVVLRHPEAMAAALAKWSDQPTGELIDYALDAYDKALEDIAFLHCVYVIRYEDLITDPERISINLHRFLDLPPVPISDTIRDGNAEYKGAITMSAQQAKRAKCWGYKPYLATVPMDRIVRHPLRKIRESLE